MAFSQLLLQAHCLIEHEAVFRGIGVGVEVAEPLELEVFDSHSLLQREGGFYPSFAHHQRVGVEMVEERLALLAVVGIGHTEETVEEADFSLAGMLHGGPVDGELAFDDQCTGANPVYPLMSDIKQIYLDAYKNIV